MYLGVGAEKCTVRAIFHEAPLMDGIGRYSSASSAQTVDKRQGGLRNAVHGPKDGSEAVVADQESVSSSQTLAWLQFDNGKLAVCDWSGDQYYSSIRSSRVLVRGERGEINNTTSRYLLDTSTPAVEFEIRRVDVGPTETWGNSLLGNFHRVGTIICHDSSKFPRSPCRAHLFACITPCTDLDIKCSHGFLTNITANVARGTSVVAIGCFSTRLLHRAATRRWKHDSPTMSSPMCAPPRLIVDAIYL